MHTHTCIKPGCSEQYRDEDPDAYYCDTCKKEREELAKQVDAKIAARPSSKPASALQAYDAAPKVHGFLHVKL